MGHPRRLPAYAAIVLAGGRSTRMGHGIHKPAVPVAGVPMLHRVLAAVPDATPRVVVGPPQPVPADVLLTRETPPGGGPAAALSTGLSLLSPPSIHSTLNHHTPESSTYPERPAHPGHPGHPGHSAHPEHPEHPDYVAVLAGDLALLTGVAVGVLRRAVAGAPAGVGGAVFVDGDGREQWLCGVWRAAALRERVAALREPGGLGESGGLGGMAVRRVLGGVAVVPVRWGGSGAPPWFDCDTAEQVATAEAVITGEGEVWA